jgi:hypothetical protein
MIRTAQKQGLCSKALENALHKYSFLLGAHSRQAESTAPWQAHHFGCHLPELETVSWSSTPRKKGGCNEPPFPNLSLLEWTTRSI